MKFEYQGYDRQGRAQTGMVEAPGPAEAREQLRGQGVFVRQVREHNDFKKMDVAMQGHYSGSSSRVKSVSGFARQLSMLVSANTPLVEAVQAVLRQSPPGKFRDSLADISTRLEQGASLSDAMAFHPEVFDPVARSLVRAGESGGKLKDLLTRLAHITRQQEKVQAALKGAMVYPVLLIGIAFSVVLVMMLFVLPRFEGLFKSLGAALPPTTQMMMSVSHGLREWWYIVVPIAAMILGGAIAGLRTQTGKDLIDRLMLSLPQVSSLSRSFGTARVARMLGVLLEGKVPLLEALSLTRASLSNTYFRRMVSQAEEAVEHGESMSTVFERSGLILPSVVEAVRNGERAGRLSEVMTQMADILDEDNELLLKSVSSLIEPLILVVLGLVVGFVALSLFLPLFDLTSLTQGGGGGR